MLTTDLVLNGHGEERLDLELQEHGAVVRVAVVLHIAFVEAGVFALQVGQEDDSIEIGELGLVLERVAFAVDDAVPAVVGYGVALGDALDGGVGGELGQLAVGKDLRKVGPDARIALRALAAGHHELGGLARLRGDVAELGVGGRHGAYVVAHVAVGDAREVEIAVARYEALLALLDFLRERVEEPDVVDVLGVLVVVEAVDDRLAEALCDDVGSLALLEAVEHDLAQLHNVRVDGAELVGGLAEVGARVGALRLADDQIAAVLEVALVGQVDRIELVLGVEAGLDVAAIPLVERYRIAVGEALERHVDLVLHHQIRAAQNGRIELAELEVLGLLDDLGTARYEAQLDGARQAVVDGASLVDDLVRVAYGYLADEGTRLGARVARPAPLAEAVVVDQIGAVGVHGRGGGRRRRVEEALVVAEHRLDAGPCPAAAELLARRVPLALLDVVVRQVVLDEHVLGDALHGQQVCTIRLCCCCSFVHLKRTRKTKIEEICKNTNGASHGRVLHVEERIALKLVAGHGAFELDPVARAFYFMCDVSKIYKNTKLNVRNYIAGIIETGAQGYLDFGQATRRQPTAVAAARP